MNIDKSKIMENEASFGLTCITPRNIVKDFGCWFVSYDIHMQNTAVVVPGADGIGVMFLVLDGNHVNEIEQHVQQFSDYGKLGEVIRYVCKHKNFNGKQSTIGGPYSKARIGSINEK